MRLGRERDRDIDPTVKPDVSVPHLGSTFEVYNLHELMASEDGLRIYDKGDFPGDVQGVTIDQKRIPLNDGQETGLKLTATIRLDPFLSNEAFRWKQTFFEGYIGSARKASHKSFSNLMSILTEHHHTALLHFDAVNRVITITNDAFVQGEGRQAYARAQPLEQIDVRDLFADFGKVLIEAVNAGNYVYGEKKSKKPYRRTYRVGETVQKESEIEAEMVGGFAVRSVVSERRPSPTDTSETVETEAPRADLAPEAALVDGERVLLDDVGGHEGIKSDLREAALAFGSTEAFEKWGAERPQGVLLYGPPGTGKTMLTKAFANEIPAKVIEIDAADTNKKWHGEGEAMITAIFDELEQITEPTVVLMDEFDGIIQVSEGRHGADNARNSVASLFKTRMNDLAHRAPNVLIVAITNDIDRIDPALIRTGRFNIRKYVPPPDEHGREDIIGKEIKKKVSRGEKAGAQLIDDSIDIQTLVRLTDDMTGSDIAEIFRRVSFSKAVEESRRKKAHEGDEAAIVPVPPITEADLIEAIHQFRQDAIVTTPQA